MLFRPYARFRRGSRKRALPIDTKLMRLPIFTLSTALLGSFILPAQPRPVDRVLFDFESGTYQGWTYEGDSAKPTFGAAPFHASVEVKKFREDRDFTGWHGDWMVIIGDTRHGGAAPGRLISDEFVIDRPFLLFQFGAEAHPAVRVGLEVQGKEVRKAYGNNSYDMRTRGWDVSTLQGRKARLVIHAESSDDMLLRADYFRLSSTPPPPLDAFSPSEQESDFLRTGELQFLVAAPKGAFFEYSTVVRDGAGKWHLFAQLVQHQDRYKPGNHKQIVHATAPALTGPWTYHGPVLTADSAAGEDFLWHPYAFFHQGRIYLFYVGSGKPWQGWDKNNRWREGYFGPGSTQGPFGIHAASSTDGVTWERLGNGPLFTDNPFAFTPFVMRQGEQWVMYYGGAEPADILGKHAVVARTSKDLVHWENRQVVMADLTNTTPWPEHSFFHDPFVFRYGSSYFLLAGPINNSNQSRFHYRRIYRSSDPLRFSMAADLKGVFAEGGPKLVDAGNGTSWLLHSSRYSGGLWAGPVRFRQELKPEYTKRRLTRKQLEDKVRGGWAGQMAGVSYGAPTEFKANGRINSSELTWSPDRISNALGQDDLYVDMTFSQVIDRYGIDAPVERFAEAFRDSQYTLWHANAAARRNLARGIPPSLSGHPRYNMHANDIDFQIEADFIGLLAPGMPRQVLQYCRRIGPIMNYGDGIYGGLFIASMYSAAYFESDPRRVVEAGLAALPPGSQYAAVIRDVLAWHKQNPEDWKKAWQLIEEKWDKDDPCPKGALDPYNIDAKINGAYVALGLLYGNRDFTRTVEIATRAGQDSDCNPATAGGILGVMLGFQAIPPEWTSGLPAIRDKKFSYTDYSFEDIVRSTIDNALRLVSANGGLVLNTGDIEIPLQLPVPPPLEQWNPGTPTARIQPDDPRWTWSGGWRRAEEPGQTTVEKGSEATLHFEGKAILLRGRMYEDGGQAEVFLDGRKMPNADAKVGPRTRDDDLWHALNLPPGKHVLKVRTLGGRITIASAVEYR